MNKLDQNTARILWSFFIFHAGLAAVTNFFLLIINLIGDFRHPWFFWPLVLWGGLIWGHYRLTKLIISGYFLELRDKLINKLTQI